MTFIEGSVSYSCQEAPEVNRHPNQIQPTSLIPHHHRRASTPDTVLRNLGEMLYTAKPCPKLEKQNSSPEPPAQMTTHYEPDNATLARQI